jgi:2-dehydropantoate 2-reductase
MSVRIKNIGIIGVGGVGGYFGGKLCSLKNTGDFRVSFIARGAHLRAIQESGLLLNSENEGDMVCKPSLATDDFNQLPPLDLCLICVKAFDLAPVLPRLAPHIGDETFVVPLMNGIDIDSRIRKVIKNGILFPACISLGTKIQNPGRVLQRGGDCYVLSGPDPLNPGIKPDEIVRVFEAAKLEFRWTPGIQSEIWKKFIFISGYALVSAAFNKTLGEILEDAETRKTTEKIISEAISIAKGLGVSLPADIAPKSLLRAHAFPPETQTSFQRDFERSDKMDERDLYAGSMIRLAHDLGIEIPETKKFFEVLEQRKPWRWGTPN